PLAGGPDHEAGAHRWRAVQRTGGAAGRAASTRRIPAPAHPGGRGAERRRDRREPARRFRSVARRGTNARDERVEGTSGMSQTHLTTTAPPGGARDGGGRVVPRGGQPSPLRVVPAAIRQTGSGVFAILCMTLLAAGLVALLMMNTALASGIYQLKDL